MDRPDDPAISLRERKQRRAREAIVEAAQQLFAEHGFDQVTVADIAERAEVGRATFFRYFGDKQEVVFEGEGQELMAALVAVERPPPDTPIGGSLPAALVCVRAIALAFVARLIEQPEEYRLHQRLVTEQHELQARSLAKQQGYVDIVTALLVQRGAESTTAALAAEVGLACVHTAQRVTGDDPLRLLDAVADCFDRVGSERSEPDAAGGSTE
jgi:AcrR family transcriptional regulator